jgi:SAM-dependent methyltransferase
MLGMATVLWGKELADHYDSTEGVFAPAVVGQTADVLAELAAGGAVVEFAVGTGRVALPLSERGVPVAGIELSPHMADVLRAKPGAGAVPVTIGDMTSTRVPGVFSLVYLVFNTIMTSPPRTSRSRCSRTPRPTSGPAGGSWWRWDCLPGPAWRRANSAGFSTSPLTTWESTRSTTRSGRSRPRTTGR